MKKQPSLSTAFPGKRENPARGGAFGWIGWISLGGFLSDLSEKEPVISQRQNLYAGSGGAPCGVQRRSLCRGMGHPSERTAKRASPLVREQRRDVRASEYPGAGAFRVA